MKQPIEITLFPPQFEKKIVEETSTYIAKIGYDIKFNKDEMVELLQLYINKPLKFEELEEGMWVWDNSVYEKNYALIKRKFMCGDDFVVAMKQDEGKCEDGDDYLGRAFEDNRFYRREVHDE